ncbi:MAG: hypothetical protein DRR19_18930 [Candidatus Parabeggiatoa sp. nov. 1]|nr:MAG: hypothetical protein DRR19_18930 [Gammaproteobacteria bacterium]
MMKYNIAENLRKACERSKARRLGISIPISIPSPVAVVDIKQEWRLFEEKAIRNTKKEFEVAYAMIISVVGYEPTELSSAKVMARSKVAEFLIWCKKRK